MALKNGYKNKSFKSIKHLPHYLIDVIQQFYEVEYVYLMEPPHPNVSGSRHTNNQWKILVDDITNNLL